MSKQFKEKLHNLFQELERVIREEAIRDKNMTPADAQNFSSGYIQSLMINLLSDRFTQKDIIYILETRISTHKNEKT